MSDNNKNIVVVFVSQENMVRNESTHKQDRLGFEEEVTMIECENNTRLVIHSKL